MIGINGMGRIGRNFFRVLYQKDSLHLLSAVNDIMPKQHLAYLLQYDTIRGKLPSPVTLTDQGIMIEGHEIKVFNQSTPHKIPWANSGTKVVIESTGVFTDRVALSGHIQAGAMHAILTTTGDDDIPLYITGVNENDFQGEAIFSVGSCTVNGTGPLLKQLEIFKPQSVYLNVIHAYSARQNILDSYYPEIRRSRASADNIIPLSINLDHSLERLFPVLKGHIKSITSRVPIPCGVLTDLTLVLQEPPVDAQVLNDAIASTANQHVMDVTYDPIVSSDVLHDPHSLLVDGQFTHIMGHHAKLLVWFDNEWGFSNRLVEWIDRLV